MHCMTIRIVIYTEVMHRRNPNEVLRTVTMQGKQYIIYYNRQKAGSDARDRMTARHGP